MTVIECPFPECDFATGDTSEAISLAVFNAHTLIHSNVAPAPAAAVRARGPKLDRPRIECGVSTEKWNAFVRRWETFRAGSDIDAASATRQLFHCADETLGDIILRAESDFSSKPISDALEIMKSFAVVAVARGVLRSELSAMRQSADEPFRNFAAKVRGKAETCDFKLTCGNCSSDVYYTDEAIRDVLLHGIADEDIRRDALGAPETQTKTVSDVIAYVEAKETARNAHPSPSLNASSSYRRAYTATTPVVSPPQRPASDTPPASAATPCPADRSRTAACLDCKKQFHVFVELRRGWNKKPHDRCQECWKARRGNRRSDKPETSAIISDGADLLGQVASTSTSAPPCPQQRQGRNRRRRRRRGRRSPEIVTMTHHIFRAGEWRRARFRDHPRIGLTISADSSPVTSVKVNAAVDSGAQANLWSLQEYLAAGFKRSDLLQIVFAINAANKSQIPIEGAFFTRLQAPSADGSIVTKKAITYVSSAVKGFYLSFESMLDLGIVGRDFPSAGSAHGFDESQQAEPAGAPTNDVGGYTAPFGQSETPSVNLIRAMDGGCTSSQPDGHSCGCPQREAVPKRPSVLPFPCLPENNEKMKAWLLQHFASSTFNTCPHRPLPCMSGPPVEIHLDPSAKPHACHTAAPIPAHWHQRVYEDLLRDEALGVIERVPYGEPVTWCHRMVVTRKHDGSPRRTVDLSPLNRHCKRETHNSETPFQVARRIPRQTWKSVTDAWNGYHSVPLRESDRHLTTFITPFGRRRYARAPQGFVSSGDGYNRRFDAILADFERQERIVDDNIHYDTDLAAHWWRTIELLSTLGTAGVVLNPDKFQFAQREVDFAGFRICDDRIDPLPKYFDAIRNFPVPTSITDIRSWFGLVNQVANYGKLSDIMAPFRPFLSPKVKFEWTPDLNRAFEESKQAIIEAIRHGVEIFDVNKTTCLRPDWSIKGVGYFLSQRHCACKLDPTACCAVHPNGWRITLAGSRFLSSAEQRYAPIEGEALAIAWSLEQTKFFTQGCEDLMVITDHKPLVKIFGDRTLDEITNTRLFRLKQRTLPWFFSIAHLPGKTNLAADATSRHPTFSTAEEVDVNSLELSDQTEHAVMASIRQESEELTSISWQILAQQTAADDGMQALLDTVHAGFPETSRSDARTAPYWRYRDSMYASDGVVMYEDRVVVPPSLRNQVLRGLHSAHQGVSTMEMRARAIIFWPGMTDEIHRVRASCVDCTRNAPSQAPLPSSPATPPSSPFEQIFADFFECGGHHYLVVGDRLSSWSEIFASPCGTSQAGANGLISNLRRFFSVFGVPEELSSDGGPEFTSSVTQEFLKRWGIRHRLSSAHHPQSNGRAEVAVKSAKRLLRSNIGPSGKLDNDGLLHAMLQLRNTPDPDCELSPAEIVFGKPLRDAFAFVNRLEKYSNPNIRPLWRNAWSEKESALRTRFNRSSSVLNEHARPLAPLQVGDKVFLQNQMGNNPKRWDRSGIVMESLGHDSYTVKVDGSGRVTKRNRKFLRRFDPASSEILGAVPMAPSHGITNEARPVAQPPTRPAPHRPAPPSSAPSLPARPCPPPSAPTALTSEQPHFAEPATPPRRGPGPDSLVPEQRQVQDLDSRVSQEPTDLRVPPSPAPCASPPRPPSVQSPRAATTPDRPRRAVHRPLTYEPESGKWV